MEQKEEKIHTGFTLREIDQLNLDVEYVRQVLPILAIVEEAHGADRGIKTAAIVYEAMDRMRRIDEIINPRKGG